jgi:hypothetical protein
MNLADRKLVREITFVIVLKLIFITALWWAFIRDAKVSGRCRRDGRPDWRPAGAGHSTTSGERHGQ